MKTEDPARPRSARRPAGATAGTLSLDSIGQLRAAVNACRRCPLYQGATQGVPGEGDPHSLLMLVGEAPGDVEDTEGHPFVGPAGAVLDRALLDAGIDRDAVFVTNAVKHFKFAARGKRRIHARPMAREIAACRPWLEAEVKVVKPKLIVCLGATAAQALLGPGFRITLQRGIVMQHEWAPWLIATYRPSALLRMPDLAARARARAEFTADLAKAAAQLAALR